MTLQVLSLFTQGGGAAVTFTTAPFVAATTGEITAAGLKQVIPLRAIKTFTSVSVTTSATTLTSQVLTMPALGGPFRVFVTYRAYAAPIGGGDYIESWVTDGTHTMAGGLVQHAGAGTTTSGALELIGSELSSTTYASGATVTFTLKAIATLTVSVGLTSVNQHFSSQMGLTVISSV